MTLGTERTTCLTDLAGARAPAANDEEVTSSNAADIRATIVFIARSFPELDGPPPVTP